MRTFSTVYMNGSDVTPWITDLEIRQPRGAVYKQFTATFAGWNAVESYRTGASWDLFSSNDPENPRAEVEIRGGTVPPDRERRTVVVERGKIPAITVMGYDRVWIAQRRRPTDTIIAIPGGGWTWDEVDGQTILRESGVLEAIERYSGPVGRYRVWSHCRTIHGVIRRLANAAGINVELRFPDADVRSVVIPPDQSYWEAIRELASPWAVEMWFRRSWNSLLMLDPESPRYPVGRTLNIGTKAIRSIDAVPIQTRRVRRVIVRFS
jgi:hypothetical protein